ncbi:TIGR03759 family integrating conjugative element protein [Shinella sp.]|uniref:TIGR03759 family integrating conjugative element protein n=1 Tax=Shinella sp. TaxID=1870904 RepID=UPI00258859F7|nr:TIGR03759 family integrating conjugative element protein [Shinella sp.]MCW5706937.1 TIGR03759 family integrating conjugative element protein [Shinella sp.]
MNANAQDTASSPAIPSRERSTTIIVSEERAASDWGLNTDEWSRYREVMQGPLGVYSPNLDPLTALGIEARSDEERRRYAELQVGVEARRVEKLLAYQRAYDEAWQRLHPGLERVAMAGGDALATAEGSGRLAVFVKEDCPSCGPLVQKLQSAGTEFDLYMVGTGQDDGRIRDWAKAMKIEPSRVREGKITLNHDSGRWLSLGLEGALPAMVRQVNGQWQRR